MRSSSASTERIARARCWHLDLGKRLERLREGKGVSDARGPRDSLGDQDRQAERHLADPPFGAAALEEEPLGAVGDVLAAGLDQVLDGLEYPRANRAIGNDEDTGPAQAAVTAMLESRRRCSGSRSPFGWRSSGSSRGCPTGSIPCRSWISRSCQCAAGTCGVSDGYGSVPERLDAQGVDPPAAVDEGDELSPPSPGTTKSVISLPPRLDQLADRRWPAGADRRVSWRCEARSRVAPDHRGGAVEQVVERIRNPEAERRGERGSWRSSPPPSAAAAGGGCARSASRGASESTIR